MKLEKDYKNNQFGLGYDLFKVDLFEINKNLPFKEALERSIIKNSLKTGDSVKLVLLHEETNTSTAFFPIRDDMNLDVLCDTNNFTCIDLCLESTRKGEFKIKIKWVKHNR